MKNSSNSEAELKKALLIKKKRINFKLVQLKKFGSSKQVN